MSLCPAHSSYDGFLWLVQCQGMTLDKAIISLKVSRLTVSLISLELYVYICVYGFRLGACVCVCMYVCVCVCVPGGV